MMFFGTEGEKEMEFVYFSKGGLRVEPGVVETFSGRRSLFRDHLQHGQQEVGEVSGVLVRPAVLLHQDVEQRPGL